MTTTRRRKRRRPGWLRDLRIERVDRVGSGANSGAHVLLFKTADGREVTRREVVDALDDEAAERASRDGTTKAVALAKTVAERPELYDVYRQASDGDETPEEEPEPTLRDLVNRALDVKVGELVEKSSGTLDYSAGVVKVLKGDERLAHAYSLTSFSESTLPVDEAVHALEKRHGRDGLARLRSTLDTITGGR